MSTPPGYLMTSILSMLESFIAQCYVTRMVRKPLLIPRSFVTIFVALAVLWGSVFAPAHATTMMMEELASVAVAASDDRAPPCPMTGHRMDDDGSDDSMMSGMRGDMSCCPPPGLSASPRPLAMMSIVLNVVQETDVPTFAPLSIPGVALQPPKG